MVNKQPMLLVIGVLVLVVGLFLQFKSPVSSGDIEACQMAVKSEYGRANADDLKMLLGKCDTDAGFVALMSVKAQNGGANQAAQAISAANKSEVGSGMLSMFLIGLGIMLTIVGLMGRFFKK